MGSLATDGVRSRDQDQRNPGAKEWARRTSLAANGKLRRASADETPMQRLKNAARQLCIRTFPCESGIANTGTDSSVIAIASFGRLSESFINDRLLKMPGDYVVSQTHSDAVRFSVMCEDRSKVHLRIVEGKYHFRIIDTVYPKAQTLPLLINKLHSSQMNALSSVAGTKVVLRRAVDERSIKGTQSMGATFIKHDWQLQCIRLLCHGNVAKSFVGKLNVEDKSESVIVKEMNEYSEQELNNILTELHISNVVSTLTTSGTIVPVLAVRVTKEPYLIVYPFIRCGSYPEFVLQPDNKLTVLDKINAAETIAQALSHVHSFGILHCDIGARNIFVRSERSGTSNDPKAQSRLSFLLGDFRRAVINKTKEVDPMKPINLRWLAPEVFSTKQLDSTTDVFAFGLTLYEIFTGNVPYYTMRGKDLRRRLIAGETIRPALSEKLDRNLCELMRSCWHMEPRQRPSMNEVWLRLRAIREAVVSTERNRHMSTQPTDSYF